MVGPPQLWQVVAHDWLGLAPPVAWQFWRALVRARWSTSVAWREQFLSLSRQQAALTRNLVGDFLGELCTLPTLIALVEALMQEHVLLRRDGTQIEERLFSAADATGQLSQRGGVGD
jgi:hypothetical protein